MMRFLLVVFSFLFAHSCLEDANPVIDNESDEEIWICHNPEKPTEHNKICTSDCYEHGNPHKFCWMLDREACSSAGESITKELRTICEELKRS